jgi:hypothetical protein
MMALLCLLLYRRARPGLRLNGISGTTIIGCQADHVLLLSGANLRSDPFHVLIVTVAAWRQIVRLAKTF